MRNSVPSKALFADQGSKFFKNTNKLEQGSSKMKFRMNKTFMRKSGVDNIKQKNYDVAERAKTPGVS